MLRPRDETLLSVRCAIGSAQWRLQDHVAGAINAAPQQVSRRPHRRRALDRWGNYPFVCHAFGTQRRRIEPIYQWLAAIAQSVEHVIRNDGVGGSIPSCGTTIKPDGSIRVGFMVPCGTITRSETPVSSKMAAAHDCGTIAEGRVLICSGNRQMSPNMT